MKVVKKVWGEEHWIINQDYCGKKLVLKKNHRCSLHHHKEKDEVFYIIKGKVLLEADNKKMILKPGDSFHIKPGCDHRFTGIENSEIIEFSSHHKDEDSYRKELSGKIKNEFEERILSILSKFKDKKILVIGDVMLDKYIRGDVEKISPESPVQVVNVSKESFSPGGAANVCSNISSLSANAFISGIVGDDKSSSILESSLRKNRIDSSLIIKDPKRLTTVKARIIGRNQQLLRLDYETTKKANKETEKKIIAKIEKNIKKFDAVIVSDYNKGVISPRLMASLKRSAKKENIPLIVDPKPNNKNIYQGVYLIKPNLKEAIEMSGAEDPMKIGKILAENLKSNILLTCGCAGMYLFQIKGEAEHLPTEAKEVYDVTGAGDTVAASFALAVASGATLKEASYIANKAAGIAVGKIGTSAVNIKEIKKSMGYE